MRTRERAELFRHVMSVVGDRMPVMLCSADSNVGRVRELTELAGDLGGLPMVTPPYVSEITDEQIIAFFQAMAPLSKTGLLVYNAPGVGISLSRICSNGWAIFPRRSVSSRATLRPAPSIGWPIASVDGCACSARPIWRSSAR